MNATGRIPDGQPIVDAEEEFGDVDPAILRAIRLTMQTMQARMPNPTITRYGARAESAKHTPAWKWILGCFGSGILGAGAGIVGSYWTMHDDVATLKAQVADLQVSVERIYHMVEPRYRGTSSSYADDNRPTRPQ